MSFTSVADVTGLFDGEGVTALVRITTDDAVPDDGLLEYGDLELGGAPVTRGITITNVSGATLPVNRCEVFVGDGFAPPPPCPSFFPLAAGASIHVDLVFTPSATGDGAARLTFSASGMNYTIQVLISARVTQHAFALSADALAFADTVRHPAQPTTADLTFTNTGTEPLEVPAASIDGAGFVVVVRPPPGTLAPGAAVTYTVGFDPATASAYFGTLVLGPPASPIASIPLHGEGVAATPPTEPGGCGCRSGGPAGSGPLLALAFAFVLRRRRQTS
jgi:MYXO-CTERM domain-containing protein